MDKDQPLQLEYIRGILASQSEEAHRETGQNFLTCPEVVDRVVELSAENTARNVTELGAGLGALTLGLITAGFHVKAIEHDNALAQTLRLREPESQGRLQVVEGDLRKLNWEWDQPYQLIGNIPYNLSGLIIRKITQLVRPPQKVVLVVQQEVGERLAANPREMNLLALAAQLWSQVDFITTIPANCFWPEPKVTSAIVRMRPYVPEILTVTEREEVMALAKPCFQNKRKQIGGVLIKTLGKDSEEIQVALSQAGIQAQQRPQELSPSQWIKLWQAIL